MSPGPRNEQSRSSRPAVNGRASGPPTSLADDRPEEAHHDEEAGEQGDQPEPAVRRVGALVGHELESDPEGDRPANEQQTEQPLRVRAGDPPGPSGTALGGH